MAGMYEDCELTRLQLIVEMVSIVFIPFEPGLPVHHDCNEISIVYSKDMKIFHQWRGIEGRLAGLQKPGTAVPHSLRQALKLYRLAMRARHSQLFLVFDELTSQLNCMNAFCGMLHIDFYRSVEILLFTSLRFHCFHRLQPWPTPLVPNQGIRSRCPLCLVNEWN